MELFLVRHAEDRAAVEGRFADEGLTARGRNQARILAARLAEREFDACWSSPLHRARQTAELLVVDRGLDVRVEPDLAEGAMGALEGLDHATATARHPDDFRLGRSVIARVAATGRTAPGGESRDAFVLRARNTLQRLRHGHASQRVLVVSHGGFLNYFVQALVGMEPRDDVPFGFEHCGLLRALDYAEEPDFGPFPMLRFD